MKALQLLIFFIVISNIVFGQCNCDPLPQPGTGETIVYVNNCAELQEAIDTANGKTTIFLNTGTYAVSSTMFIIVNKPNITIRSTSGNRDDVIFQGEGMAAGGGYVAGFLINEDNITIADLTVCDVPFHAFHVVSGDSCLFHNVRGLDSGEHIFRAVGIEIWDSINDGLIECSTFEYTTTLDDEDDGYYTTGIGLVNCHSWILRDNIIKNIKHNPSYALNPLAGPAIIIRGSNTIVERNSIIECDQGIYFGWWSQNQSSHTGGIIRNNFILGYSLGYSGSEFGIGLIRAPDAKVINNTVYSPGGWQWSIEARFPETNNCLIMNNFSDEDIYDDRDGASCTLITNNTNADSTDFVNIVSGDLHLSSNSVSVVNTGTSSPDRTTDIDCGAIISLPDIGADEFGSVATQISSKLTDNYISIYPNPSNGIVIINTIGNVEIEVINMQGEELLNCYTKKIDLSDYPKGIYLLKVTMDNQTITRKLIKQ